jgi:FMN phosphatase YigB (HAD superfamily)
MTTPSTIDTVLFDAVNTLWHQSGSILDIWADVLERFDAIRTPKEIIRADFEHQPWLEPEVASFETSGKPVSDEAINAFWIEFNRRMLRSLGIEASVESVVSKVLPVFDGLDVLYDDTVDVLASLQEMGFPMAIVSNGVYQQRNAARTGIEKFFDSIIGSWHVGSMKPEAEIFNLALRELGFSANQALMVGDTWNADVIGSRSLGIRTLQLIRYEIVDESNDEISTLCGVVGFFKHQQQEAR